MKKILLIAFVVVIILIAAAVQNNSNPRIIISKLSTAGQMRPGEYVYRIYLFGFLPIGKAVVGLESQETFQGESVYHMTANASSAELFSSWFKTTASIESYIGKMKLNPLLFRQKITQTGKPDTVKEAVYNQKEGVMTTAKGSRSIPADTQDPLSLVLRLKKMDFNKVQGFEFNLNNNQKNYTVKGNIQRSNIFVDKKTYDLFSVKADISRRDKNPYHKSQLTILFLPAQENIPLLIKVFASGVFVNARLVEIRYQ